jgi:hypothetical protein
MVKRDPSICSRFLQKKFQSNKPPPLKNHSKYSWNSLHNA